MVLTDAQVLARCPLFAELGEADLLALTEVGYRQSYDTSEAVFFAGDEPQGLHVVVSGRVKVFVVSPATGREVVLTVEHPFNTVAELVAMDGGPYPASAEAAEPTEVLVLEQQGLTRVLRQHPEIALHLMRTLGRRLRRLVAMVEAISFQEVIHRLSRYLLAESRGGVPFTLDTNAAIAAQLGTVPELVSRNLSRLHAGEAIQLNGRVVTGLDRQKLEEMAGSAGR